MDTYQTTLNWLNLKTQEQISLNEAQAREQLSSTSCGKKHLKSNREAGDKAEMAHFRLSSQSDFTSLFGPATLSHTRCTSSACSPSPDKPVPAHRAVGDSFELSGHEGHDVNSLCSDSSASTWCSWPRNPKKYRPRGLNISHRSVAHRPATVLLAYTGACAWHHSTTPPQRAATDPSLARYSERQLAVANTWATHFSLAGTARTKFIRHHLRSTSTTRCWCITVAADNGVRYTIMRAGPLLQVFDGQLIGAWECRPAHRIPASTPSPAGLEAATAPSKFDDAVAVLSSYTKRAHDLATQMARDDLGLQHRLVYPSHSNKRYYTPRHQFYLKQIGAVL